MNLVTVTRGEDAVDMISAGCLGVTFVLVTENKSGMLVHVRKATLKENNKAEKQAL